MAPIRISSTSLQRRRRSSLALSPFVPAKPGIYGINRPVTFAPNVTPGTYVEPEEDFLDAPTADSKPTLFPPSEAPLTTNRKRCPPGKRRSQGYIPRPANAFMLFRADFVRQRHVPGSIETNYGSLSKIIGTCWRSLPLEEKRVWELKAKHAKAEHKVLYPDYRFRPVHNKNKDKKKEKQQTTVEDERRCEQLAQLLLEGKKGEELAAAVHSLDRVRPQSLVEPVFRQRRSSSVPLPNDYLPNLSNCNGINNNINNNSIALPSISMFPSSRPSSPVPISHHQRRMLGTRRSSSAGPSIMSRPWTIPIPTMFHDHMPLPEADTSLFNPSWSSTFPTTDTAGLDNPFNFNDVMHGLSNLQSPISHDQNILGPLDTTPLQMIAQQALPDVTPDLEASWMSLGLDLSVDSFSKTSSMYSGSPEPTEGLVHAPRPQPAGEQPITDMLMFPDPLVHSQSPFDAMGLSQDFGLDYSGNNGGLCGFPNDMTSFQGYPAGLDPAFDVQPYDHHNALY
ncbi:hypothetical protein AX15_002700 [Amanita polypyramis BW_CC]|nr:hypothetical protein AX15_002700 [Amanita polypyramis BW_CC]